MSSTTNINYETTIFDLKADHLGPNRATLLHARTTKTNQPFYKAILYIHGYLDYFFHDHFCQELLNHGYDFFALDLRKCGRSIISPNHDLYKHYFQDITDYFEEITLSIEHILKEAKGRQKKIILYGHSTGGLVSTLYGSMGAKHSEIDALILNSPYLAPLDTSAVESVLMNMMIRIGFSKDMDDNWYGRSIHKSSRGEWDFDCTKKPIAKVRLHGPSFFAIRQAQELIQQRGPCLSYPILCLCSNRSIKPDYLWRDEYGEVDLILNVTTMRRAVAMIGRQVTICEIENAKHDVFLSKVDVREKAFATMFHWLKHLEEDWSNTNTTT